MANGATAIVIGRLTREPQHNVVNNQTVVQFSLASDTFLKKEDGTGYETNFYNVSMWGKPAEWLLEKLQKGTQVEVVGELALQKYTNKQTGEAGQSLNIRAFKVTPLQGAKMAPRRNYQNNTQTEEQPAEDNRPF